MPTAKEREMAHELDAADIEPFPSTRNKKWKTSFPDQKHLKMSTTRENLDYNQWLAAFNVELSYG